MYIKLHSILILIDINTISYLFFKKVTLFPKYYNMVHSTKEKKENEIGTYLYIFWVKALRIIEVDKIIIER